MPSKLDNGIQPLLYTIIIHERQIAIDVLADTVGCSAPTIYDYLERRPIIPIKLIKTVYEMTGDARIRKVLEPKGYRLEPRTEERETTNSIERDLLDVVRAVARLDEDLERSMSPDSDGGERLTPNEIGRLETLIDRVKSELADVQAHLNKGRSPWIKAVTKGE